MSTNRRPVQIGSAAEKICLACGLCCNGVIFADVRLQPGDNIARLRSLGMLLTASNFKRRAVGAPSGHSCTVPRGWKFNQPCPLHDGHCCRIYAERPRYCRLFECALLKRMLEGNIEPALALGAVRAARRKVDRIRRLLRQLGDVDETMALAARFRRTSERVGRIRLDKRLARRYGKLTVAFHGLNLLISKDFYPGGGAAGA